MIGPDRAARETQAARGAHPLVGWGGQADSGGPVDPGAGRIRRLTDLGGPVNSGAGRIRRLIDAGVR